MRARSWRFGVWMAVAAALGCSAQAPPGPSATHGDLAASLVELGQAALARGELAEAENRFERALRAQPGSAPARVGLGRVAAARGQSQEAEERFQEALELDPGSVDAHLGLGRLQAGAGRPALARAALSRAVALDPWRADAHAELAALTGLAPRAPVSGAEAALRVAQDHPYDVWAGLRAARALALAGRAPEAIEQLQGVVWLADRDPASGRAALELLGRLDPAWRGRPVVPVHCWADDGIRARPGWRFRLRLAWLGITETFRETLAVRFVPFSLGAFSSQAARPELEAILAAFRSQSRGAPRHGILAGFTDRAPARRPGRYERGLAEFLGRRLIVRLEPEGTRSRVLAHEMLHLYGGVHVVEEVPSLMNPTGDALVLDPPNARIVRELRDRRFQRGDLDVNVIPWIDLDATAAAYESALRVNLAFRRAGITQALEASQVSRADAARIAREARELDPHLADVSAFVATLMLRRERPDAAIAMLEVAARLYGPNSPRGKRAQGRADTLRRIHRPEPDEPAGRRVISQ